MCEGLCGWCGTQARRVWMEPAGQEALIANGKGQILLQGLDGC